VTRYGSTFTGIGGLDLAVEHVFGARCVWQCERSAYCREVLDQWWPGIHRWRDVHDVGVSAEDHGVDIVCGGFPCQDVSAAGPRVGLEAGERTGLWRELARVIREFRPRVVVLENVPGLLRRGLDRVLQDLAASGYDASWDCLRADQVGAPHRRERLFVLAYTDREFVREFAEREQQLEAERRDTELVDAGQAMAHPVHDRRQQQRSRDDGDGGHAPGVLADRHHARDLAGHAWPPGPDDRANWERWPGAQPAICGGDDGAPGWVDRPRVANALRRARLRALGNAVVWQQAAVALQGLVDRVGG